VAAVNLTTEAAVVETSLLEEVAAGEISATVVTLVTAAVARISPPEVAETGVSSPAVMGISPPEVAETGVSSPAVMGISPPEVAETGVSSPVVVGISPPGVAETGLSSPAAVVEEVEAVIEVIEAVIEVVEEAAVDGGGMDLESSADGKSVLGR